MMRATSCYRIGDRYDDVIVNLDDENEPTDVHWEHSWEYGQIMELTEWADRHVVPAYFSELSYEYACPPDFKLFAD
jgi:hypothetical protein